MRSLPLYREPPITPVELEQPRAADKSCQLCKLHEGVKSVCLSPEGSPGGLYVVAETPGQREDALARPFSGESGRYLRTEIRKHWRGPVALDNATRCFRGQREMDPKFADACRGYIAGALREVKPQRIIACGEWAIYSLLGRTVPVLSVRGGYAWLSDRTPVFLMMNPAAALRNRFFRSWFEKDLTWALTTDVAALRSDIPWSYRARFVETAEDARMAVEELRAEPWVAFDGEWAGDKYTSDFDLLTIALSGPNTEDPWVWEQRALNTKELADPLRALMSDPNVPKGGHGVKNDMQAVRLGLGVSVRGIAFDTLVERKAIESDIDGHLNVSQEIVGMGGAKEDVDEAITDVTKRSRKKDTKTRKVTVQDLESIAGPQNLKHVHAIRESTGNPRGYAFALIDPKIRDPYCARDALSTARVHSLKGSQVAPGPRRIIQEVMLPAIEALDQMEAWGIAVSLPQAQAFSSYVHLQLGDVRKRLNDVAEINWGSDPQIKEVLFSKLKLPVLGRSPKTGLPTADAIVLEALKNQHPVVGDLLELRRLEKQLEYADIIPRWTRRGRIHATFKPTGARTGRISVEDPPLHQIPKAEDTEGKMARDCYVAPEGRKLVSLDYKQLELFIMADISGDKAMRKILEQGIDYHMATAQLIGKEVWGLEPHQVGKPQRSIAKNMNFGLCIAEGSAVLTEQDGEVPIESVRSWHRLWDGVAWVQHDGLVCRGEQEVIEHAGLWATPEHEVFTEDGRKVQIRHLASEVHSGRCAIGAVDGSPVGYTAFDRRASLAIGREAESKVCRDRVQDLHATAVGRGRQLAAQSGSFLQLFKEVFRCACGGLRGALRFNEAALRAGYARVLKELQGARDQGSFQLAGALHKVGSSEMAGYGLQGSRLGSDRQRWALFRGQHPLGVAVREPQKQKAKVYDLLNAGPRHRFTANGKIVSNSYGMTPAGFAARQNCSVEVAEKIQKAILSAFTQYADWREEQLYQARRTGVSWIRWKGVPCAKRDLYRICDYDGKSRSNAENASSNTPIQGEGAYIGLDAVARVVAWILKEDVPAKLVLTVHDSLIAEVDEGCVDEFVAEARAIMTTYPLWTPLRVDAEVGDRWGSLVKHESKPQPSTAEDSW